MFIYLFQINNTTKSKVKVADGYIKVNSVSREEAHTCTIRMRRPYFLND